jgi:L-ascorbate metabolism protein UlaG (beta-lactamase superfamily)
VPSAKTDLRGLDPSKNLIVWFGHSSYLIQVDGKRILVDPVFFKASPVSFINRAFPGTKIYKPEDMPDIDYLVITHDHWDHLDYKTVKRLRSRVGAVICPLGVGSDLEYWGYPLGKIKEMDWYQDYAGGEVVLPRTHLMKVLCSIACRQGIFLVEGSHPIRLCGLRICLKLLR